MSNENASRPTTAQLEAELEREIKTGSGKSTGTAAALIYIILTVIFAAALMVFFLPALKITGNSMNPTLENGDIVIAARFSDVKKGDVGVFRYGNQLLVKRLVATGGDIVNIDEEGNLSLNRAVVDEPYIKNKALGMCDLEPDFKVPAGCGFFMGDNRSASMDSRLSKVGCPDDEQIIGRVILRVWPLSRFGTLKKAS